MRALIKNSKKVVINQVDPSERALIDDFVRRSLKRNTVIKSLYDIDNDLDGISFELAGKKQDQVSFKTPCIQVIVAGGNIEVDLKIDDNTIIDIDPTENEEYLEVSLNGKLISISGKIVPSLMGTTGQYIVTASLSKEGFEPAIVPINVSVLYIDGSGSNQDYEKLQNLPKINNKILIGNRDLDELGIQEEMDAISNSEIDEMI